MFRLILAKILVGVAVFWATAEVSRPPLSVGNVMKKGLLIFGVLGALTICEAQIQSPQETISENLRCYGRLDFAEKTVLIKLNRIQKAC